jgi:hypothetical protein
MQAIPQSPQLATSFWKLTHVEPHWLKPSAQVMPQEPLVQVAWPFAGTGQVAQGPPPVPQAAVVVPSVQVLPLQQPLEQLVVLQTQELLTHVCPAVQQMGLPVPQQGLPAGQQVPLQQVPPEQAVVLALGRQRGAPPPVHLSPV